jgi:nicotinamide-nucleotide amidase
MAPVIEILIVGNEILSGRVVDSNSAFMIDSLARAGFPVRFISTVGDDLSDLAGSFQTATARADVVLATGGLGPTSDDITAEALAISFGKSLVLDQAVLRKIEELFRRRQRFMSDSNSRQAMLPEGATALDNPQGTAPGIRLETDGKLVYLMPGVPREMRDIFKGSILPELQARFEPERVELETVRATGISESELYDRVKHLPGAKEAFAFYPNPEGILVRIQTGRNAPMRAGGLRDEVVRALGDSVYSTSDENLEMVAGKLLSARGLTLGIAESCTGGLISHRITNVPGSSAWFLCGVTTYSNESKRDVLGVDAALIDRHGAVSAEVAAAMAEGIRRIAGSDIGISTTGIAGPGGGSEAKPVGLMYAGYATAGGSETKRLHFVEDRIINKNRMSQAVLDILRLHLQKDY